MVVKLPLIVIDRSIESAQKDQVPETVGTVLIDGFPNFFQLVPT